MQNSDSRNPIASIARKPLHEEVAERIRELITEGVLPAGGKLNERVLCGQLLVSRTPLREALKLLAAQKLVELSPNRGASVAALTRADIEQLFELMAALEGLSGALAARRCSASELTEFKALHFEMLAAHARRDLPAYYRINRQIHELINRCARNKALSETYDSINLRIQNLRFRSNFNIGKWDAAVKEHEQMLDAMERRDAARMRELLEQHLRHKLQAVLEHVDSQPQEQRVKRAVPPAGLPPIHLVE
jgi:DNA-binding GntR family transcriptional regulator